MERRDKIAVLGYTTHRNQAPLQNSEWTIYGLNDLYHELPTVPFDRLRWFQIHPFKRSLVPTHDPSPMDFSEGPPNPRDPNHVLWLKELSKSSPVYILQAEPELPDAIPYPMDEVIEYFGPQLGKYLTNSISYMLAIAIMELAPASNGKRALSPDATIGVFGVDMMVAGGSGSEYGFQRPSCEAFLGFARGAGIEIIIPKESDLLKAAYPYASAEGEYFRVKMADYRNEMSRRRGEVSNNLNQMQAAHQELSGAINACDYFLRAHLPGDPGDEQVGRAPVPDSHKPLQPGVTNAGVPYDNGEGPS